MLDKHNPFNYEGKTYSLSHLNTFYVTYIQKPKNDQQKGIHYKCLIEFSDHCFTRSPNANEVNDDLLYENSGRFFCFERYKLSLKLYDLLRNDITQHKCYFSDATDKFISVNEIDENGDELKYEIYFSLKKSKDKKIDIHIFINSAYKRTKPHPTRKKVSLFLLLNNTLLNKRIKKPT